VKTLILYLQINPVLSFKKETMTIEEAKKLKVLVEEYEAWEKLINSDIKYITVYLSDMCKEIALTDSLMLNMVRARMIELAEETKKKIENFPEKDWYYCMGYIFDSEEKMNEFFKKKMHVTESK
jgi:hypothetical protein